MTVRFVFSVFVLLVAASACGGPSEEDQPLASSNDYATTCGHDAPVVRELKYEVAGGRRISWSIDSNRAPYVQVRLLSPDGVKTAVGLTGAIEDPRGGRWTLMFTAAPGCEISSATVDTLDCHRSDWSSVSCESCDVYFCIDTVLNSIQPCPSSTSPRCGATAMECFGPDWSPAGCAACDAYFCGRDASNPYEVCPSSTSSDCGAAALDCFRSDWSRVSCDACDAFHCGRDASNPYEGCPSSTSAECGIAALECFKSDWSAVACDSCDASLCQRDSATQPEECPAASNPDC